MEGQYQVSVTNGCGMTTSSIIVPYITSPTVNLGPDFELCPDSTQLVSTQQERLTSYLWSEGSQSETLLIEMPDTYTLTASNVCGTAIDTLNVPLGNCDCALFLPNVMTPNGDQINDAFEPLYPCRVTQFDLNIFDRWGKEVFTSSSYDQRWDGSCGSGLCPSGVYYYVIKFQGDPLVEAENEVHRGHVTLLR